ncbi:MAG: hypothetical protein KJS45_03600 [Bacteroidetes bacterium]|nr:hypothetical protein [Bacteroidota bacterium]
MPFILLYALTSVAHAQHTVTTHSHKPIYTQGLHLEYRDTLIYVTVPDGEHIEGYRLMNSLGHIIFQVRGVSNHMALFALPDVPAEHYLMMIDCGHAFYCRRIFRRSDR